MKLKQRLVLIGNTVAIACGLLFFTASSADAHGVSVFAWVDGDTIHVESKFSGGRKPKDAPIEVFDDNGHLLLEGRTNDDGEFSFQVPQKTEMKIVLTAGMGHKAEWTIPVQDLQDVAATPGSSTAARDGKAPGNESSGMAAAQVESPGTSPPPVSTSGLNSEDLQRAIEAALDKKLKPVMKMLAESRQSGPSIRDVVGGIGYILGLVGLATFVQYRRKKNGQ
jgi:nickel transport protein